MEGAKISDEDNCNRRRSNRIGLDVDNPSQLRLLKTFFNAHYFFPNERIEVTETGRGFHFRIFRGHTLKQNFEVRRALLDDPVRLSYDEDRVRHGLIDWVDTLFNVKKTCEEVTREKLCEVLASPFYSRFPARKIKIRR